MLRSVFINLSNNNTAKRIVTEYGPARRLARRFVAGESLDEAVAAVRALNQQHLKAVLNHVGESVTTREEASAAAQDFQTLLQRIATEGIDATISIKPSHVGMGFGVDFCYENIADIVQTAKSVGNVVELDIEHSEDVAATLEMYHKLLDTFGNGIRQAVQTYLYRTPEDVNAIIERGSSARLVKGAYKEPPNIAIQDRKGINDATINIMEAFLTPEAQAKGAYLALGSHDAVLIDWLLRETAQRGISKDRFEIQMLLGVRRDEQQRLAALGYTVRVYMPYGTAWYPYFMRRLAERPANVLFMARAFLGN